LRLKLRKFAIVTTLITIGGMAGVVAVGTASASALHPRYSHAECTETTKPSSFEIMNHQSEYYAIGNNVANAQYFTETNLNPEYFCPQDGNTISGTTYYNYYDNGGFCLTADASNGEAYEADCGHDLASQEWHYYYKGGADKDGTLKNYGTGKCLWFSGNPNKIDDPIEVGGCTRNQNNTIQEEGD
jgi:hypothetical protein